MSTYRVKLHNAQQGNTAINALYRTLKPWLISGHTFDLIAGKELRRAGASIREFWFRVK